MNTLQQHCQHPIAGMGHDGLRVCALCRLPWRYASVIVADRKARRQRDQDALRQQLPQLVIVPTCEDETYVVDVDDECLEKTNVMFGPPEPMCSVLLGTGITPRLPAKACQRSDSMLDSSHVEPTSGHSS